MTTPLCKMRVHRRETSCSLRNSRHGRRFLPVVLPALLALSAGGCLVSESEYQEVVAQTEELEKELADLQSENVKLNESVTEMYRERERLLAQVKTLEARVVELAQARPKPTAAPETEGPAEYVVRSGDTLNAISARLGVPKEKIMELNNIGDESYIWIGQKLILR